MQVCRDAIAEYDESDNRSRRYIHGTRGIDERAVMLDGPFYPDTYYYMLQELDTVTGLITKNGSLTEAYTYDAYGKVSVCWTSESCAGVFPPQKVSIECDLRLRGS